MLQLTTSVFWENIKAKLPQTPFAASFQIADHPDGTAEHFERWRVLNPIGGQRTADASRHIGPNPFRRDANAIRQ
jgi:hypothetical protein